MKWSTQVIVGLLLCGVALTGQLIAKSESDGPSFAQIVLPFPGERPFTYEWQKADNTLLLRFPKSSPAELDAINNYDERLIRRVLFKDQGCDDSDVGVDLFQRNTQSLCNSRIISIFQIMQMMLDNFFDNSISKFKVSDLN